MSTPNARVDALFALPLERFVAERDALAKALSAAGDRESGAEVRSLAKPTRAAWAVNMAVRAEPAAAQALSDAARLLAEAQEELLAGGDPSALHEAGKRAWAAVETLAAAAPAVGNATLDKVRATLHAATADPDVLSDVTAGRLPREQVASGFAGLTAAAAVERPSSRKSRPARGASVATPKSGRKAGSAAHKESELEERRRAQARAKAEREAAAREEARRQEKLRRAKEAEAAAEHDLTAAERALEQVESALTERRAEVRDARARLKGARRRRERAER